MRPACCAIALLALFAVRAEAACVNLDRSHGAWTAILERWVEGGEVDYGGLAREGQGDLDAYLALLSGTCAEDYETWSREDRIAFWINAYNAFTVRLILDHYPIASIRRIGWLPLAAFRERFIPMPGLRGGRISLQEIEDEALRRAFREPRIHFALVCASKSCPELRREAYRGAALERQLDEQARGFLADRDKNRVDAVARKLWLSSIFKWYRGDFEASGGTLQRYVAGYLDGGGAEVAGFEVDFLDYDWSLNDRKGGTP